MVTIEPSVMEWGILIVGAFILGMSKTSINSLGGLVTPLFAAFLFEDITVAAGVIVPLFIVGDACAVLYYRKHVPWNTILTLMPWVILGIFIAHTMEYRLSSDNLRIIAGGILLVLVVLSLLPIRKIKERHSILGVPVGITVGAMSMLINAGGAVSNIYFILMNMKKMTVVGSAAGFFCIMNIIKLFFRLQSKTVYPETLLISTILIPVVILGAVVGVKILRVIPERVFRISVVGVSLLTAIQLLLF